MIFFGKHRRALVFCKFGLLRYRERLTVHPVIFLTFDHRKIFVNISRFAVFVVYDIVSVFHGGDGPLHQSRSFSGADIRPIRIRFAIELGGSDDKIFIQRERNVDDVEPVGIFVKAERINRFALIRCHFLLETVKRIVFAGVSIKIIDKRSYAEFLRIPEIHELKAESVEQIFVFQRRFVADDFGHFNGISFLVQFRNGSFEHGVQIPFRIFQIKTFGLFRAVFDMNVIFAVFIQTFCAGNVFAHVHTETLGKFFVLHKIFSVKPFYFCSANDRICVDRRFDRFAVGQ